jgi:hypothetical protein
MMYFDGTVRLRIQINVCVKPKEVCQSLCSMPSVAITGRLFQAAVRNTCSSVTTRVTRECKVGDASLRLSIVGKVDTESREKDHVITKDAVVPRMRIRMSSVTES